MNKKEVDLTIVILNYNTGDYLKKCLESLDRSKRGDISWKIIVVDNNSSDGSENASRKFADVETVKLNANFGFAKGNNKAKKYFQGEYILFLNPDTEVEENTIYEVFRYMQMNPEVGAATSKLVLADGTLDEASHRGFPKPLNSFFHFSGITKIFPKSKMFSGYTLGWKLDDPNPHEVDSISGAFFFVRKKAGEEVGWWDEDYYWYGEDLEFSYSLKEKGWKVVFLPQVKTVHYRGISSGIKKHSKEASRATREVRIKSANASTDAMKIFYKKHYLKVYPKPVTFLVLLGISIIEKIRLQSA